LSNKLPEEVARRFGIVEGHNFFAHTIREIELFILEEQHRHYHIITAMSDKITVTETDFYELCCEIRIATIPGDEDDCRLRLSLAHELGHLVYNIDKLDEATNSSKASHDEECWAWRFAYALTMVKSHEHEKNKNLVKFIYNPKQLLAILLGHLKDRKPNVYEVLKDFSFPD